MAKWQLFVFCHIFCPHTLAIHAHTYIFTTRVCVNLWMKSWSKVEMKSKKSLKVLMKEIFIKWVWSRKQYPCIKTCMWTFSSIKLNIYTCTIFRGPCFTACTLYTEQCLFLYLLLHPYYVLWTLLQKCPWLFHIFRAVLRLLSPSQSVMKENPKKRPSIPPNSATWKWLWEALSIKVKTP